MDHRPKCAFCPQKIQSQFLFQFVCENLGREASHIQHFDVKRHNMNAKLSRKEANSDIRAQITN